MSPTHCDTPASVTVNVSLAGNEADVRRHACESLLVRSGKHREDLDRGDLLDRHHDGNSRLRGAHRWRTRALR
jgi:hypothetical protein